MTRRDLLQGAGVALAASVLKADSTLPGTQPLTWQGDLSERMMDGAHKFVERKIAESVGSRHPDRDRLRTITGVVDSRLPVHMERFGVEDDSPVVAETQTYRICQVHGPVLAEVYGEGLLLEPLEKPIACVIALPDADQTAEQICGLAPGIAAENQFARRLAENGFVVVVPTMIDRTARWSGHPEIRMTDQPHREWIYRQAYHMGRHVIGYEVQKVLSAVDWFRQTNPAAKIGVAGYAEGGLIGLYAAAIDPRIDAALVSGYFSNRQKAWSEPIYRNIWSLLTDFGDAEIASLIAPRALIIEIQPDAGSDQSARRLANA
jgi:hypothetical protein